MESLLSSSSSYSFIAGLAWGGMAETSSMGGGGCGRGGNGGRWVGVGQQFVLVSFRHG